MLSGTSANGMATALFLDFDNLYLTLTRAYSAQVADRFGKRPKDWLSRLAAGTSAVGGAPRRFTVLRCYMRRDLEQRFGRQLIEAGFDVIVPPRLTSGGKNATDIRMAMDIVRLVTGPSRHDEFMLLSDDSDFTPVLQYLRENGRGTAIVTSERAGPAYRGIADLVMPHAAVFDTKPESSSNPSHDRPLPPKVEAARAEAVAEPLVKLDEPAVQVEAAKSEDVVVLERLRALPGVALLAPDDFHSLFVYVAAALHQAPFHLSGTPKLARELALADGVRLSRTTVERLANPVVMALLRRHPGAELSAQDIGVGYRDRLLSRASASGWNPLPAEITVIDRQLGLPRLGRPLLRTVA